MIITDYLTFAKPELNKIDILDVGKELKYIKNEITPYATMNQVDIKVIVQDNCTIISETKKFHQALINLSKNAVEAMPSGGTLEIKCKLENKHTAIIIRDTGKGMTSEQINRLGMPYFSTKEIGTGLGTMVVYSVVKAMNGKIKVNSQIGQGTCFTIYFPKAI